MLFNRTGVRFEVALDVLGAHLAHYAETIAMEQDQPQPDVAVIDRMREEASEIRVLRDDLDPTDGENIERVIREYGPQARAYFVS